VDVKKIIALVSWAALAACLNAQITLGPTVGTFGVLASSTVTNTGATAVTGTGANLGVSPGTAITGFPPGTVNGTVYSAGAVAATAQGELTAAYNAVAGAATTSTVSGNLSNQTFNAGVYTSTSSLGLTGPVTLDAQNNSNAQFIFQIGSTLTANIGSSVILINGAVPANVFWLVGSSATIGTGVPFYGNILAQVSITINTGASLQGRALARTGAVTLDDNAIVTPSTLGGPGGGTVTPPVPPVPPAPGTPVPSSLILVATALGCAGIYRARRRLLALFGWN
jgi:hypothetical protein